MKNPELILFAHIPLPREAAKVVKELQKAAGYKHPFGPPHITLYLCRYTEEGYKKLLEDIKQLTQKQFPINMSTLISKSSKNGGKFYYLKIKNLALERLHTKVVRLANPHRGTLQRSKELERMRQGLYNKKKLEYLHKYGYTQVLDRYNPHVTIADVTVLDTKTIRAIKTLAREELKHIPITRFTVTLLRYDKIYTKLQEKTFRLSK